MQNGSRGNPSPGQWPTPYPRTPELPRRHGGVPLLSPSLLAGKASSQWSREAEETLQGKGPQGARDRHNPRELLLEDRGGQARPPGIPNSSDLGNDTVIGGLLPATPQSFLGTPWELRPRKPGRRLVSQLCYSNSALMGGHSPCS